MKHTVLTVDDAATMRKMISVTLRGAGYDVLEASDGMEAATILKNTTVDLVISDINMPRMNGIELTRQVRSGGINRTTPILLLTTESSPEMKNKGREAGATAWIVKPFQPDQLAGVVGQVLSRTKS